MPMRARKLKRVRPAGFTLLELMVVIVILIVLSSLVIPAIAKARFESRKAQCTNNLKQLGAALIMYQSFEGRQQNAFPERLTHLADPAHLYVNDDRVFVCPMDYTHAKGTTLKPGNPVDNKYDWAERVTSAPAWPGDTRQQRNCSYLYEFSTRVCEYFNIPDADNGLSQATWSGGWASDFLVDWYDLNDGFGPQPCNDAEGQANASDPTKTSPDPAAMSLFGLYSDYYPSGRPKTGVITWQEAKFWQLAKGDICGSGLGYPGDSQYPASWFNIYDPDGWQLDPADMIFLGFTNSDGGTTYSSPQHGYAASWLPIVRCFWHQTPALVDNENFEEVLNLAVDGNTFYSAPGWEQTAWNYGRNGDMPDGP